MLPWVMVHLQKPEDVPVYTIWRVDIDAFDMFRIFIEVLCDHSSSLYMEGGFTRRKNLYIAVDKEINILLHSTMTKLSALQEFGSNDSLYMRREKPNISRNKHLKRVTFLFITKGKRICQLLLYVLLNRFNSSNVI